MRFEEHGEPAEVEEFRLRVLARQTEAEEVFAKGIQGPGWISGRRTTR
jgi:hypothetical protein